MIVFITPIPHPLYPLPDNQHRYRSLLSLKYALGKPTCSPAHAHTRTRTSTSTSTQTHTPHPHPPTATDNSDSDSSSDGNNYDDDTDDDDTDNSNNSGNNNCDTEKPLRNIITNIHRDTRHVHPTGNAPRKPAAIRTKNAPKYNPKTQPNRTENITKKKKYTRTITREVPIAPTPNKTQKPTNFPYCDQNSTLRKHAAESLWARTEGGGERGVGMPDQGDIRWDERAERGRAGKMVGGFGRYVRETLTNNFPHGTHAPGPPGVPRHRRRACRPPRPARPSPPLLLPSRAPRLPPAAGTGYRHPRPRSPRPGVLRAARAPFTFTN